MTNRILKIWRTVCEMYIGYVITPLFGFFLLTQNGIWKWFGFITIIASFSVYTLPSENVNSMLEDYFNKPIKEKDE